MTGTVQQTLSETREEEIPDGKMQCPHCPAVVWKTYFPEHLSDDCPGVDREVRI